MSLGGKASGAVRNVWNRPACGCQPFFFGGVAALGVALLSFFGAVFAFFLSLPWELLPLAMTLTSLGWYAGGLP